MTMILNNSSFKLTDGSLIVKNPNTIVKTNLTHLFDASTYPGSGSTWTNLAGSNNLQVGFPNNPSTVPIYVSSGNNSRFVFDGVNEYMSGSGYLTGSAAKSHTLNLIGSFSNLPATFARYRFFADNSNPTGYGVFQYTVGEGITAIEISQGTPTFNATVYDTGGPQILPLSQTAMFTFVSKNTGIDFYVNGSYVGGTTADTFVDSSFISNTRLYYWGCASVTGGGTTVNSPVSMSISHIMWYSASLSAVDILQNYNALKGRYGI